MLITKQKKVGIGILTADCAPVLFYDKKKTIIGAAHVGWKGAYKKILPDGKNLGIFNLPNLYKLIDELTETQHDIGQNESDSSPI